jgi:hypothetical protein
MAQHTASDIVSLVRATSNGEFSLSGSEAELLVTLFASVAAAEAACKIARIGDHDAELQRKLAVTAVEMGAQQ